MKKLPPKYVASVLKKNNVKLEKIEFEKFVKELAKEANPAAKLDEFIKEKQKV